MKVAAIVLVVLGAISLGIHNFGPGFRSRAPAAPETETTRVEADNTVQALSVISGIAVVGGLLFLVIDTRRN